jgi:hypothetical protein
MRKRIKTVKAEGEANLVQFEAQASQADEIV